MQSTGYCVTVLGLLDKCVRLWFGRPSLSPSLRACMQTVQACMLAADTVTTTCTVRGCWCAFYMLMRVEYCCFMCRSSWKLLRNVLRTNYSSLLAFFLNLTNWWYAEFLAACIVLCMCCAESFWFCLHTFDDVVVDVDKEV